MQGEGSECSLPYSDGCIPFTLSSHSCSCMSLFHFSVKIQPMRKFFQRAFSEFAGVLCDLHAMVLPSVTELVSTVGMYINAPYRHPCLVNICVNGVSPLRMWTPQSKDYVLFIFVFPGLENKHLWEKGREKRKEKSSGELNAYIE